MLYGIYVLSLSECFVPEQLFDKICQIFKKRLSLLEKGFKKDISFNIDETNSV